MGEITSMLGKFRTTQGNLEEDRKERLRDVNRDIDTLEGYNIANSCDKLEKILSDLQNKIPASCAAFCATASLPMNFSIHRSENEKLLKCNVFDEHGGLEAFGFTSEADARTKIAELNEAWKGELRIELNPSPLNIINGKFAYFVFIDS